jgi:outer membrane receptor protein involved in Fe transport
LPLTSDQNQITVNDGYFARGNFGVDFLMDNRNTLTVSQSLNKGSFQPSDSLNVLVDTLNSVSNNQGHYYRRSNTERTFQNLGTSALYKHLFTKEGTEFTADFNYNAIKSKYNGDYKNVYDDRDPSIWQQLGDVAQKVYTFQMDFVSKINDKVKFEAGRRFSLRKYESQYDNLRFDALSQDYIINPALKVDYAYQEQIEAMYSTLSINGEKWKYQIGLRAESSFYTGTLKKSNQSFRIDYPVSLFPSLYVTRVLDETQDIQLSLNRRINRPSFMQLSPFTDYSDSLNVSRGNPNLKPEFTHSAELSYLKNFSRQHTFVASAYSRYTTNVTIKQQVTEFSPVLNDTVIINTSLNAYYGWASGIEMVLRNGFGKWLDLTTTVNIYNSTIDGSNISPQLTNSINSYWVKMNCSFKLPKNIVLQVNGDYASKKALDVGSSERGGGMGGGGFGGGGGGGMHGGPVNTVQGYVRPNYGMDISIKKDFLKDRSLTISLAAQDVFHTRITSMYSASPYFIQDSKRYRDWQVWRFNVSWKFGKVDSSLFKRKNNKMNAEGMEG